MSTELKRFTISVTPSMEAELDTAKKECYYKGTQNAMIRDLIVRGLASLHAEEEDRNGKGGQNTDGRCLSGS
ncbi:MAG: hypothetical protein IJ443_00570 [Firmicutes bacterium]|nr:hypothetical protein [Bacillota bacterium]